MSHACRSRFCCALRIVLWASAAVGWSVGRAASPPRTYTPQPWLRGTVRVWGSPADGALIGALAAGFDRWQPRVHVRVTLHGPESTFAGVYMDVADIAFMVREIRVPLETMAFEWVHHYSPFTVQIANAGLGDCCGVGRPGVNLAFFVRRGNPLVCLTLRQLDEVFAADHRRGGSNVRRWGDLGLQGSWAGRPIHVYGPPLGSIAAVYIRHTVLKDSYKWNAGYYEVSGGRGALLATLARDPDGIAFAALRPADPRLVPLRVAASAAEPCTTLDARSAETHAYPLARSIDVALDRKPGTPLRPPVAAFLRFILSPQGQGIIARNGAYLPLSAATVSRQLRRLE